MAEEERQISIEDLELALEVYEIQSDQKFQQLKTLFAEKGSLNLTKMFYEERSSIEIKFQNIIGDLIEFLIKQEVATTEKLRKTFYRVLENPLLLLFKVSRFELFDLRLNGFDIELEPIEAIVKLSKSLEQNIEEYLTLVAKNVEPYDGKQYKSFESFLEQALVSRIQDKIFAFYSYLRKGAALLKKKFEIKAKIADIFNSIESKLLPISLKRQDTKTIKQLSVLNYEIFELEPTFDVLYFFLRIPFLEKYKDSFQELELLAGKAKQTSNFNVFILFFLKHEKEIMQKLRSEKVDGYYKNFIQNAMKSILEMWGCRICYYKEFCELFICLFKLHPQEVDALEFTLNHNPNLTKEDIVLLRQNFKLSLEKNNNELLTLLKASNMDEVNQFLNIFYHQTLYNMDLKVLEREKVINLMTLMNGNSSLNQLFFIAEKAFKEWNHTIDFAHSHKFIETEFAYPKIGENKIKECFSLLTNLCCLEEKGFNKEYETLIKAGTIGKALLEFVKFLQKDEKSKQFLEWPQTHRFFVETFNFLRKSLNPTTQTSNLAIAFTPLLSKIQPEEKKKQLEQGLIEAIEKNIECFHIEDYLNCFKGYKTDNMKKILDLLMAGVQENNELVIKFGYLDEKINNVDKQSIPQSHAQFIESKYTINNGRLTFKDPAIFNLSDLQILTIPSQIDKVIDNYYFTLDSNSKKFIEYLVDAWNKKRPQLNEEFYFYCRLISAAIQYYPITVPLLSSVRINEESGSSRFVEILASQVGVDACFAEILLQIGACRNIRYKNGKDYVQEEVIPMAMKILIKNINSGTKQASQKLLVLAKLLGRANLAEIRLDTIQKAIQKIRFLLVNIGNPSEASTLGEAFKLLMSQFFQKKQKEMRKAGLVESYNKLMWNEVRNYVSNLSESKAQLKDDQITEFIVISPFTITQEFNIEDYKIKKSSKNVNKGAQTLVSFADVLKKVPVVQNTQNIFTFSSSKGLQTKKRLLATNIKYDLQVYLGKQKLKSVTTKENIELILNQDSKQSKTTEQKSQDMSSFVQYYMKQLAMPSIGHKLILEDVTSLLQEENPVPSFLWTNGKNLENYFTNLISIFQFAALEAGKRVPQKNGEIQKIVKLVETDSLAVMKKVLKLFAGLGYSNIWAESFDMFWNNFPIRKFLGFNKSQQSFLSIILKNTLERPELRDDLTNFLGSLFETRNDQNALMYKVTMDKNLMNIIMKSLSIPHLPKISLMFHSNFNNLRLYTDQLHEGLKALNIASKNRAYNEYIKMSKSVEDEEFSGPLTLFKENFRFFIRIEKEGYQFKKNEETNLALGRLTSLFRNSPDNENISKKVNQILEQYIKQISELQLAIANRVKSFYLVTKLRDLCYQNSLTLPLINQIMQSTGKSQQQILQQINKLQLFSLLSRLYNQLIQYQDDWRSIDKYSSNNKVDGYTLENQLTLCSTRRFSHSMSKIYHKCQLQFDQVMQRCVDVLKGFFVTGVGAKWMHSLDIYPAFFIKSFISRGKADQLSASIFQKIKQNPTVYEFVVQDNQLVESLVKGFRSAPRSSFTSNGIKILLGGSKKSPIEMLKPLQQKLLSNQTFVTLKSSGNIIFNKFKSSQATLEEIQVLGYIIAYALLNKLNLGINLHPSIISALSFNIAQLDNLLDIDFKIWEELRNVMSVEDSGKLALNFSYNFQSLDNFKPVRIQLIDKGSSKKLNNLNREQYCDLVCCYILYEFCRPHINRLLSAILTIVPKQLISCTSTKQILEMFYPKQKAQKILDEYMKKIGVVLPQTLIDEKGKRIENLKDFQNILWLQECILESPQLRAKYWKDQTNLFAVTTISGRPSLRVVNGKFLIEHFTSKQQLRQALTKL